MVTARSIVLKSAQLLSIPRSDFVSTETDLAHREQARGIQGGVEPSPSISVQLRAGSPPCGRVKRQNRRRTPITTSRKVNQAKTGNFADKWQSLQSLKSSLGEGTSRELSPLHRDTEAASRDRPVHGLEPRSVGWVPGDPVYRLYREALSFGYNSWYSLILYP
jgi:hypothetical protein